MLGQACPGSAQEGPGRVAQCPHKRRSGARGRSLFAHRGKPGWHSAAVFNTLRPAGVMVLSAVCPMMSEPQPGVGEAGTAMSRARSSGQACRNEERGVAVPRPGGTRLRLGSADFGKLLPWHGSSGRGRRYSRPAVFAAIAPNPVHADRKLARHRDFGASHADAFC